MSRFFLLAVVLAVLLAIATAASSSSAGSSSSISAATSSPVASSSSAPVASSSSSAAASTSSPAAATSSQSTGAASTGASSSSTGAASSTGSSTGGSPAPTLTFCQTYSATTTNVTAQVDLLTAIVVRAVTGGCYVNAANASQTICFPGLFNASGPLYNIFTGTTQYRVGAPNYVNDTVALGQLATHLVEYFGALFGCTAAGYPAVNNPNMYAVHQNMNITQAMETYFNNQLAYTLLSFGVPYSVVIGTAAPVLGWFNKCGPPIPSISTTAPVQICGDASCTLATDATYQSCINNYGYPGSSSSSSGGINVNPSSPVVTLSSSSTGSSSTNGTNSASSKYALGAVSVAAAAVVATLLL